VVFKTRCTLLVHNTLTVLPGAQYVYIARYTVLVDHCAQLGSYLVLDSADNPQLVTWYTATQQHMSTCPPHPNQYAPAAFARWRPTQSC
jgi:hypothetical protein